MYGTIARMRIKEGMQDQARELMDQFSAAHVPGDHAVYVYRMDANPLEYMIVAVFEDKESYWANANSPDQDTRYRQLREILSADPEWNDGEIIYHDESR